MTDEVDVQFGALKIFVAVAESETLTQAAARLGITQSAVSQAISQLENLTSTELVLRRSRPVTLTPSGKILHAHAEKILADSRRMIMDVQRASSEGLTNLNVGIVDSFADAAGPQLLERISSRAVQLSMHTGLVGPLSKAFISRELDILITSDLLQDFPDLERHPVLRDPFVLLLSENCYEEGVTDLQHLAANVPFVRYSRQSRLGNHIELINRRLDIQPVARYELDNTQTLMHFVEAGNGWAIATGLCIVQFPELLQGIKVLPLGNGNNARYLSLLARHNELGDLPEYIAGTGREIHDKVVLPETLKHVPWLKDQATSITELPII